jgi:tRNA(Ile)-lysidine synthase
MGGHSLKLSDFMINTRIPRQFRSAWPLILSAGEIAWVPGYAIADRFGIDSNTRHVLEISLRNERRIGGDDPALS